MMGDRNMYVGKKIDKCEITLKLLSKQGMVSAEFYVENVNN